MSNFEEELTKGEKIIVKGERSNVMLIIGAVIAVLLFIIAWPIALIFLVLIYSRWIINLKTDQFYLTNKRVYGSTGIIKKDELDIPIGSVNTISVDNTILGKIFGYSKISVKSHGEGWTIPFIKNAKEIKKQFYELSDK